MIQAKNLSLYRGPKCLLDHTNFQIHAGWKVALIGENGCGKSTLFSLIQSQIPIDTGTLDLPGDWQVVHMSQEIHDIERPAIDYVLDGFQEFRKLEAGIQEAEATENHQKLAQLHDQFDKIKGYLAVNQAEKLLSGLGFQTEQFRHRVAQFSGGWRVRLNLARTLMAPSDLLLLDEPTNHLDLEACIWLEKWLNQYSGTLLFVSHDRDFIDNVSDHILSFEHKGLQIYRGNYLTFEQTRSQRLAQQQQAFEKQQVRVGEIKDFVARFRAKASKAKQAQARLKELERMEIIAPAHVDSQFTFRFRESDKLSDPLISLHELSLGYQHESILNQLEARISPGDRIGLLGANGQGKSTLIKALAGDISPIAGHIHRGQNLAVGYFAQHQLESLDFNASPLLTLTRVAGQTSEQELRNFLGSFGFHGDDTEAHIGKFSGGEKARLCLALIAWQKPNLLLLDEPTNHLDLEIRHALTMALQDYEGALIVVSHDRHLLRNTVDNFWLIANGNLSEYDGSLDDYRSESKTVSVPTKNIDRKQEKKEQAKIRQQLSPARKKVTQLETRMEELHAELESVQMSLAAPELYQPENSQKLQEAIKLEAALKVNLVNIESHWMTAQESLEHLEIALLSE